MLITPKNAIVKEETLIDSIELSDETLIKNHLENQVSLSTNGIDSCDLAVEARKYIYNTWQKHISSDLITNIIYGMIQDREVQPIEILK